MLQNVTSVVFTAKNRVACSTSPADLGLNGKTALVESRYTCISAGTEIAKLTGLEPFPFPCTLGNRAVGRVLAHSNGRSDLKDGELVLTYTPHCSHAVTDSLVAPLPESLDCPEAALLGMAMVALAGVQTAAPALGDVAVVTGAGLVGQFAAQLLQLSGARVILIDPIEGRLRTARACGISQAWQGELDGLKGRVLDFTHGRGTDLILECTGVPRVAMAAAGLARQSGTMILVGSPRGQSDADITPFLQAIHLWRPHCDLTLKGAHEWKIPLHPSGYNKHSQFENVKLLAALMQAGSLRVKPLLSATYKPADAASAYENLQSRKNEVLGSVFDWTAAESA